MLGLSKNCLISQFIIELYILHLQAVISSEEEEGHQGRIDRKVLFRYKPSNIDTPYFLSVFLWKFKEGHLNAFPYY